MFRDGMVSVSGFYYRAVMTQKDMGMENYACALGGFCLWTDIIIAGTVIFTLVCLFPLPRFFALRSGAFFLILYLYFCVALSYRLVGLGLYLTTYTLYIQAWMGGWEDGWVYLAGRRDGNLGKGGLGKGKMFCAGFDTFFVRVAFLRRLCRDFTMYYVAWDCGNRASTGALMQAIWKTSGNGEAHKRRG